MGIEIREFNGEGYAPLISYNGWRVAVANFCERLREENICKVERHLKTDEVFILLQGEACLHLGMELKRIPSRTGAEPNCPTTMHFRIFRRAFARKISI